MTTTTHMLGAGPQSVIHRAGADGTFAVHVSAASPILFGHGNSRREAAKHLADQLREQARLVEALEGSPRCTPGDLCGACTSPLVEHAVARDYLSSADLVRAEGALQEAADDVAFKGATQMEHVRAVRTLNRAAVSFALARLDRLGEQHPMESVRELVERLRGVDRPEKPGLVEPDNVMTHEVRGGQVRVAPTAVGCVTTLRVCLPRCGRIDLTVPTEGPRSGLLMVANVLGNLARELQDINRTKPTTLTPEVIARLRSEITNARAGGVPSWLVMLADTSLEYLNASAAELNSRNVRDRDRGGPSPELARVRASYETLRRLVNP